MSSKNLMAMCPIHQIYQNMLIKANQKCTLTCPNCILQIPNISFHTQSLSTGTQYGILICNEAKIFFEMWTRELISYLQKLVNDRNLNSRVINISFVSPQSVYWAEDLIKMIRTTLIEQINIFQGNLNYIRKFRPNELTNQVFLTDLYSMVLQSPELSLEIIIDRFKKMVSFVPTFQKVSWQFENAKFSQQFIQNVKQIKKLVTQKCNNDFIVKLKTNEQTSPRQNENKVIKNNKIVQQHQIQSQYQDESQKNEKKGLQQSEVIEKLVVQYKNYEQKNSSINEKTKQKHYKKDATKINAYRTPQKKQAMQRFNESNEKNKFEQKSIPSTQQTKMINSKQVSPRNIKTIQPVQHRVFTDNNETGIQKFHRIVIQLQEQNKKLLKLKKQLDQQIQTMKSRLSELHSQAIETPNVNKDNQRDKQFETMRKKATEQELKIKGMQQQIVELKRHIDIKQQLCKLQEEKIRKLQQQNQLNKAQKKQQLKNEKREEQHKKLIDKSEQILRQNKDLQQKLDQSKQISNQIEQILRQNKDLQQKLDQSKQINNQIEKGNVDRQMKLQQQIQKLNQLNTTFMEEIKMKNKQLDYLQNLKQADGRKIQQISIQINLLNEKVNSWKQKQADLLGIINKTHQENQVLRRQNKVLSSQNENVKNKNQFEDQIYQQNVLPLNKQIQELKEEVNKKSQTIMCMNKDFIQLEAKCANNEKLLQEIINELKDKQNTIEFLSNKITEIQKQLVGQSSNPKEPETQQIGQENKKKQMQIELNFYKFINEQLAQSTQDLTQKIQGLEKQLTHQKLNKSICLEKSSDLHAQFQGKLKQLQNQNLKLSASNKQQKLRNEKNEAYIVSLNATILQLQKEIENNATQYQEKISRSQLLMNEKMTESSLQLQNQLKMKDRKNEQLQKIMDCLVKQQRQKQQYIRSLKHQIAEKADQIDQKAQTIRQINAQKEDLQRELAQIIEQNHRMTKINDQFVNQIESLHQQSLEQQQKMRELENIAIQAERDKNRIKGQTSQQIEKSRVELQKKINMLESKTRLLENQLKKQSDYDEQLMEQLINCQSKLKSKQFELDKLVSLCYQILGQLDQSKRVKYEQFVSKIKPTRLKTQ